MIPVTISGAVPPDEIWFVRTPKLVVMEHADGGASVVEVEPARLVGRIINVGERT